jgi:hypothetical protein
MMNDLSSSQYKTLVKTRDAIHALAIANTSEEAVAAMTALTHCGVELAAMTANAPEADKPVSADPAYFEFALMMVKRATELNRNHCSAVAYIELDGKAHWFGKFDVNTTDAGYVEVAARALLLAVQPQIVDAVVNGKDKTND